MSTVLNKGKLNNLADEIWKSAQRLRGKFKAYEYQSVIMPIIVIRRLECVLIVWREKKFEEIRKKRPKASDKEIEKLVKKLELNPREVAFSNKTKWTLEKICKEDPTLMEKNFRAYINGFSDNIQDIIDHFDYRAVIGRMVKNARLSPILRQYSTEELGPDNLSNLEMGYVYEELLRRFSEQSGEEAGDHFTPREVIRLMVELLGIPVPTKHISIYDPACGTGGMLSVAKEHLLDKSGNEKERKDVELFVTLHGHELLPSNYAICKADMLIKGDQRAEICYGNSLIPHSEQSREPGDQLAGANHRFDYMLSNPPFGVTWGGKDGYEREARRYKSTRYTAGMPRTTDGALLFLQTMLAKMKPVDQGGSRIAIIFNGSPLSNGDCGSGESEIRRWILENDWLDAIVMLPDQLFGDPFDTYSEAEAIEEGYIVDVAIGIVSYKTLYNLHCPIVPKPDEEKLYPKGVISKALKNVAYQDESLIQYKAEVMLRIFEEKIKHLIDGCAKAMIVATSRLAGLRYFQILKDKMKEKGYRYKVLYAFSDFVHPDTNELITEHAVNDLKQGELIEDRFEGEDYRLMIVASKFQTGFNQPLLTGMFLDKAVVDRNAVQTVSRLNRKRENKNTVVVVDFTNNAHAILKAQLLFEELDLIPSVLLRIVINYDIKYRMGRDYDDNSVLDFRLNNV